MISILYRIGKKIVVILHIYGALAIFLLFCNHKDSEFESRDMEFVQLDQYLPEKYLKGSMGQQYPHFTRWEKNIVEILHIYGARAVLLLFYNNQDTEYKSREIEIVVS